MEFSIAQALGLEVIEAVTLMTTPNVEPMAAV